MLKLKVLIKQPDKSLDKMKIVLKPPSTVSNFPDQLVKSDQSVWVEKYRPVSLSGIIGNEKQIAEIREWFSSFKSGKLETGKGLLLSGPPGTSKTSIAYAFLREYGYDIIEYNASDIRSGSQLEDSLLKIINTGRVEVNRKPFGIVMDEIDGMSTGDKGGMSQLIECINPQTLKVKKSKRKQLSSTSQVPVPIICICNNNRDKKILELKKECLEVLFDRPSSTQLVDVIDNVSKSEGFTIEHMCRFKIAELAQGDYRRLLYLLQNLYSLWIKSKEEDQTVMTCDVIYNNLGTINEKFIYLDSKQITNKIFGKPLQIEDIYHLYESEKSSIPMMIYENYVSIVNVQSAKPKQKLENCLDYINAIVLSDTIEKEMFTNQNWKFQQIHALSCCYEANYYANKYVYTCRQNAKWTSTLGKYSLQKSTIKNISSLAFIFNNGRSYNTVDVQVLSQLILFNLLDDDGDRDYGLSLLRTYNLDVDDIEKLIRTNQLSEYYKELYKSKQKTLLAKLFTEKYPCDPYVYKDMKKRQKLTDRMGKIQFNQHKKRKGGDDDDDYDGETVGKVVIKKKVIGQVKKSTVLTSDDEDCSDDDDGDDDNLDDENL